MTRAELIRKALDRAADDGGGDLLDADLAAIENSFGALVEDVAIDRRDGAREEHLRRVGQQ